MNRTFKFPCGAWKPGFSRFSGPVSGWGSPFGDRRAKFALRRVQSPAKDRCHPRQIASSEGKEVSAFALASPINRVWRRSATSFAHPKTSFRLACNGRSDWTDGRPVRQWMCREWLARFPCIRFGDAGSGVAPVVLANRLIPPVVPIRTLNKGSHASATN